MNQNHKYQLATIKNNQWEYSQGFSSYEDLINFLVRHQNGTVDYRDKGPDWNNPYLNNINMNFNDKYNNTYWSGEKRQTTTYTYEYMFIREDDAIVDVRLFYNDIIKQYQEYKNKRYCYSGRRTVKYKFRCGPVPFIGKRTCKIIRNVNYGRLIRMFNHPEYKKYNNNNKYYDILEPWYEYPYKAVDKSWKTSFKCKKQWQKHINKK